MYASMRELTLCAMVSVSIFNLKPLLAQNTCGSVDFNVCRFALAVEAFKKWNSSIRSNNFDDLLSENLCDARNAKNVLEKSKANAQGGSLGGSYAGIGLNVDYKQSESEQLKQVMEWQRNYCSSRLKTSTGDQKEVLVQSIIDNKNTLDSFSKCISDLTEISKHNANAGCIGLSARSNRDDPPIGEDFSINIQWNSTENSSAKLIDVLPNRQATCVKPRTDILKTGGISFWCTRKGSGRIDISINASTIGRNFSTSVILPALPPPPPPTPPPPSCPIVPEAQPCQPENKCLTGKLRCSAGVTSCQPDERRPLWFDCGFDRACDDDGTCLRVKYGNNGTADCNSFCADERFGGPSDGHSPFKHFSGRCQAARVIQKPNGSTLSHIACNQKVSTTGVDGYYVICLCK